MILLYPDGTNPVALARARETLIHGVELGKKEPGEEFESVTFGHRLTVDPDGGIYVVLPSSLDAQMLIGEASNELWGAPVPLVGDGILSLYWPPKVDG